METIYDLLTSYGLTSDGHRDRLNDWSPDQVIDFLVEICSFMTGVHDRSGAPYSFIANGPMAGDATRCSDVECRLGRVEQTARFASLYADRVLLLDPFEQFVGVTEVNEKLLNEISVAVQLLHKIRPTVQANLIGFATGEYCFCQEHYEQHASEEENIDAACEIVQDQFGDKLSVEFRPSEAEPDAWEFCVNGPDTFVEHGQLFFILRELPEVLADKLDADRHYTLSNDEIWQAGFPQRLAAPIMSDLLLQNLYATQGFHYLTDRELDLQLIAAINDPSTERNSEALLSGMSHTVPLVPTADLSSLAKLRTNEGEAFCVYRDRLNTILKDLAAEQHLTEGRVREAFRDAIEPEINRIEQAVRDNKSLLWGKLRQDVVFGAGIISVGLFSGLFPPAVGEIFAGLGGFKFVTSLLEKTNALCKEPEDIRKSSCYFLWKASKGQA